ncbi:hypothetical protein DL770_005569 [Monosporascus sp. CRB-9-2]|nr:hypothetical protein DL770_005569 [Monosporascus sp. CRB-9-2]
MFSFLKHLSILLIVLLLAKAAPFSQGAQLNSTNTQTISRPGISDTLAMPTTMQTIQRVDVIHMTAVSIDFASTHLETPTMISATTLLNATATEDAWTDATDDCLGLHRRSEPTLWLTHRAPFGRKGGKSSHSDCGKPSKTARKLSMAVIAGIVLGSVFGLSALAAITTLVYKIVTRDGRGAEAEAKREARRVRSEQMSRARAELKNIDFVRKEAKETRNTENASD